MRPAFFKNVVILDSRLLVSVGFTCVSGVAGGRDSDGGKLGFTGE
jgi:hypothetical protein